MLEEKNNRIPLHWEKRFIFMQIVFFCPSNVAAMNRLYISLLYLNNLLEPTEKLLTDNHPKLFPYSVVVVVVAVVVVVVVVAAAAAAAAVVVMCSLGFTIFYSFFPFADSFGQLPIAGLSAGSAGIWDGRI